MLHRLDQGFELLVSMPIEYGTLVAPSERDQRDVLASTSSEAVADACAAALLPSYETTMR